MCTLCSEEISKSAFNAMIGLVDRERIDAALYDDFESEKAKEVIDRIRMSLHMRKLIVILHRHVIMLK